MAVNAVQIVKAQAPELSYQQEAKAAMVNCKNFQKKKRMMLYYKITEYKNSSGSCF